MRISLEVIPKIASNSRWMVNAITRIGAVLCVVCQLAVAGTPAKPRMTKEEVITIARSAIEARFQFTADKHYHYDETFNPDGI
jgi:hypothetical protein